MKIVGIEPLGIEEDLVMELGAKLERQGHQFVYYNTRVTDTPTLIQRGKDADIVIVANLPLNGAVIEGWRSLRCV